MRTIFGMFIDAKDAKDTVQELLRAGFSEDDMNVIVEKSAAKNLISNLDFNRAKVRRSDEVDDQTLNGLDLLLSGQQAVQIPDVGEVYASGELATVLARTASVPGAVDDGLEAALDEFGIPDPVAEEFISAVNKGNVLFFIRTEDDRASKAASTLRAGNAKRVDSFPP